MSKANRIREMQEEINELKRSNENMQKVLEEYRKRDNPMVMDFIKLKEAKKNEWNR